MRPGLTAGALGPSIVSLNANKSSSSSSSTRRRVGLGRLSSVCVECLFLRTPSRAPYRTPSACANRAAHPDPPPVSSRNPASRIHRLPDVLPLTAQHCVCVLVVYFQGHRAVCVYYCRTYYKAVRGVCVFITAVPITKLFARGGTRLVCFCTSRHGFKACRKGVDKTDVQCFQCMYGDSASMS